MGRPFPMKLPPRHIYDLLALSGHSCDDPMLRAEASIVGQLQNLV